MSCACACARALSAKQQNVRPDTIMLTSMVCICGAQVRVRGCACSTYRLASFVLPNLWRTHVWVRCKREEVEQFRGTFELLQKANQVNRTIRHRNKPCDARTHGVRRTVEVVAVGALNIAVA